MSKTEREKDDFWAIEKLVPKKTQPKYSRPAPDVSATEIEIGVPEERGEEIREAKLTVPFPAKAPSAQSEIIPEAADRYDPPSPLIKEVRIFRWKNNYNYYEDFRADALRYLHVHGTEAPPAAYFSYVPQYVQLSREQLAWYLWWRELVRNGQFPEVNYSFIILLIYEIINVGDLYDVNEGKKILCELYLHYRKEYPRIEHYLGEWICDYSLIHHLTPPTDTEYLSLVDFSTLKEFYFYTEDAGAPDYYARLLIRFCSGYDYRKSKFASGENLALYEKHLPAALSEVILKCSEDGKFLSGAGLESNSLTRDAYSGALCSAVMKRRIEVDFCSFSRSHELRFLVADIIKYSENKLRAHLGIKSRLGVFGLAKNVTAAIDSYFASALPSERRQSVPDGVREDYEKLYDVPTAPLSFEHAGDIEKRSWDVTKKLVETFEEEEPEPDPEAAVPETSDGDIISALGDKFAFVKAALEEDFAKEKEIAGRLGMTHELLADTVNELAADLLGDVVLEETDGGYAVIEDYREVFEK